MLIGSVSVICLVTNTLDQVYVPHLFWFVLGCIDTPDRTHIAPQYASHQGVHAVMPVKNRVRVPVSTRNSVGRDRCGV